MLTLKEVIVLGEISDGKASVCNAGHPGSIPGLGRSSGEGKGHAVAKSWTQLSDFHFYFCVFGVFVRRGELLQRVGHN